MSDYKFYPNPQKDVEVEPYITWEDGFTDEELNAIESYCDANLIKDKAQVGSDESGRVDEAYRSSNIGWIENTPDTAWFYDKMAYITRMLNSQFYNFDIYGFVEHFQYTVYDSSENGHYTWHLDAMAGGVPRKLSVVLQLTDPVDYDGGELEIMDRATPLKVERKRGLVAAFPSYRLHRVSPVTRGIRKTIVIWSCGPAFK